MDSLDEDHDNVDEGDVVDGPHDVLRLVEERLGVANIVAHLDAPQQEDELSFGEFQFAGLAKKKERKRDRERKRVLG